jgi:hypothetical protein
MKITISRPVNGISLNGDEYLMDAGGNAMTFDTVRGAVNFLADRNWTLADICGLDFEITEEE